MHGFAKKDLDDIIKNDVVVTFGKGEDNIAGDFIGQCEQQGLHTNAKTYIHPSTLKAFVKERVSEGKSIDLDLFGAFIANVAQIRRESEMSNAVAKTKGVEVSTEVVVDMFEDGAEGAVFSSDDLLIPRLQLAQKMSPELDENDAKYIDGIKAGNFFNSVSREIYTEIDVIPCHSRTSYTEWVPRDQGGGRVAEHDADSPDVKSAETHVSDDGKRKDIMQNGNELVIADEFYSFIVKERWRL